MRVNRNMVDFQLELINDFYNKKNEVIQVIKSCGYYNIVVTQKDTGGERHIRGGLSLKEAYTCLYVANEIIYQKKRK